MSELHALWLLHASLAACRTHARTRAGARTPARVGAARMQQLGAEVSDVMGGSALITGPCLPCRLVPRWNPDTWEIGESLPKVPTLLAASPLSSSPTHPLARARSTPPGGLDRRNRVRVQVLYSPMPIIWLKPMEEAQIPDWPHFNTPMCVACPRPPCTAAPRRRAASGRALPRCTSGSLLQIPHGGAARRVVDDGPLDQLCDDDAHPVDDRPEPLDPPRARAPLRAVGLIAQRRENAACASCGTVEMACDVPNIREGSSSTRPKCSVGAMHHALGGTANSAPLWPSLLLSHGGVGRVPHAYFTG